MTKTERKPDGCTLEGMIWRANDILAKAASKNFNGIPKDVFQKCQGIIIISAIQVGLMFTNSLGAGIALAKKEGGGWSLPCACSLTGLGFGFVIEGGHTDFLVFIMDKCAMETFVAKNAHAPQNTLGAKLGSFDRTGTFDWDKETAGTVSISFSKGAFIGVSLEGSDIYPRDFANRNFYGYNKNVDASEILFGSSLKMPKGKVTLIEEVYDKLDILAKGKTAEPDDAAKVEAAKEEAHKANEKAEKEDKDVVTVSNLATLVDKEKEAAAKEEAAA